MTIDAQLEDALRGLLASRTTDASVSVNEAAKAVGGPRWRSLAMPARRAATRLVQAGELEIESRIKPTDMLNPKNAVRVRRAR